jgi:hypothetical protein
MRHSSQSTANTEAMRAPQPGHRLTMADPHVGQAAGSFESSPSK